MPFASPGDVQDRFDQVRSGKSSSAGGVKALMHVNGGRRSIRSFTYVLFRKGQTEYRASHALGIVRTSEGMEASDV
jgi:hypothetical protein